MSNTDQAPEPTMDEILASIRRIISDEPTEQNKSGGDNDSVADDIARALNFDSGDDAGVTGLDDDILELTEVVAREPAGNQDPQSFAQPGQPPAIEPIGYQPEAAENSETSELVKGVMAGHNPSAVDSAIMEPAPTTDTDVSDADSVAGLDISAFEESALFADEAPENVQQSHVDAPDFQQVPEANLSEPAQNVTSMGADDSSQSSAAPELGEALSWDSLEGEFGQEASASEHASEPSAEVDPQQSITEAVMSLSSASGQDDSSQSGEHVEEDQSVTFGELSPEESLESALEQAINDIDGEDDIEAAWADDDQDAEGEDLQAANVAHEEQVEDLDQEVPDAVEPSSSTEVPDEGNVGDMEVTAAASVPQEEKDELEDALLAAKEAVAPVVSEELSQSVSSGQDAVVAGAQAVQQSSPEVSEVVPVQQQQAAPVQSNMPGGANPLEESIKDMLKPMLKQWLDENMPRLLQGVMKDEKLTKDE